MMYEPDEHGTFRPVTRIHESAEQVEMRERSEAEHAPGVAVRMNSRFQLEYYNQATGHVVSCHY